MSDDRATSMYMRVVSPITPQFISQDMRNTLRISENIRHQQNSLIASGQYKSQTEPRSSSSSDNHSPTSAQSLEQASTKASTATSLEQGDHVTHSESDSLGKDSQEKKRPLEEEKSTEAPKESQKETIEISDEKETLKTTKEASEETKENENAEPNASSERATPSWEDGEFDRITQAMARKKLKRNNAPNSLHLSPRATKMAPDINSAPIRAYYPPSMPYWRMPVRYVYPHMPPVPLSAVHYQHMSPYRRMPTPDRRPRGKFAPRRKPVLDVFEGDVTKFAPMPSQPPSAQLETFGDIESDRQEATAEEMEEMESKEAQAQSLLTGSITFNEESAFNFKIFNGEEGAKEKFMKICETTWDQYASKMARPDTESTHDHEGSVSSA